MIEDRTLDRDYSIDLIKISACIAVIGLHTFQKDLSVLNSTLYYLCGFAIPAFWMSSGAILMNRGKMNWRYSFSKILKVLRVVIIWNLLVICGLLVAKFIFTIDYSFSLLTIPKEIIKSLLQKGVLWHFWYFGALMILYLLLPILYKINDLGRWILLSIIGLICLTFQIYSSVVGYPIQKYVIQTFRLWTWLFYFIGGGGIVWLD